MSIGTETNLSTILDSQGIRRNWLADQLGISKQLWSHIEHGRRRANPEIRAKLSLLLRMPESVLFAGYDVPKVNGYTTEVAS